MVGSSLLVALGLLTAQSSSGDFQYFREEIQPIFLTKRPGHARCVACHQHRAQFHLEPLSRGATNWNEAQSRRNFASALRLITPGEPLRSRLLTMPLSEESGGSAFHPGGKHWETRDDATWQKLAAWVRARAIESDATSDLDFDFFRARVEPILLKKRPGHARCVACHQHRAQFHLEPLEKGSSTWSEEASRRNYASARRLVVPGAPERSRLLLMPLAEEAGGLAFHPGGKHWESKDHPDFQTLVEWIRGAR